VQCVDPLAEAAGRRHPDPEPKTEEGDIMLTRTLLLAGAAALVITAMTPGVANAQGGVYRATLGEMNAKTGEVSTEEVRRILADGSAILLDSRKHSEYVAGHIAGAKNAAPEAGSPPAAFVAAVERLVGGDKAKPLVLYCNGQHCQASRQLSEQLVNAGFTNVRRYQLGIPMWRALNGPIEIELEGVQRVYGVDKSAIFIDARAADDFAKASLANTHSVPADKLATDGLRKAPMPNNDFNTRIVLFGRDKAQARMLADAVGKTPYQNVSYFPGTYEALAAALNGK
jgi:rhodanese-related sulfurtransferase